MIQTAEGALNEVHSMLQRMRELALQAANDTLSVEDRAAVNREIQQLRAEIDNVSQRTTFNGKALLTGALTGKFNPADSTVDDGPFGSGDNTGSVSVTVSPDALGGTYTFTVDGRLVTLRLGQNGVRQTLQLPTGNVGNGDVLNFDRLGIRLTLNVTGSPSYDALGTFLNNKTVVVDNGAAHFQVGPASSDSLGVGFEEVNVGSLDLTRALDDFNMNQNVVNAQRLVARLDSALNSVSQQRGKFGAVQNRLEHTVASLGVAQENMSAAESRIRDVDMAKEMVQFTRNQILLQAGTAMLAQANAAPQVVLQLLR
jgi:flagellin